MSNFEKSKAEYQQLQASPELRQQVEALLQKQAEAEQPVPSREQKHIKGKLIMKRIVAVAASVVLVAGVAINASPTIAYAVAELPLMDKVVQMVSFGRYQIADQGYEANINIPQLEGLADQQLQERINQELRENAQQLITDYQADLAALQEEFGDQLVHMGLESDYLVKTDTEDYYAVDIYVLNTAASSSTKHNFYTVDKRTGELVTLPGLFQEGANYQAVIDDYLLQEMERMNNEEEGLFFIDEFHGIDANQLFYINGNGQLVICFNKYDVAAGAQGSPEFVIPAEMIQPLLR